MKHIQRLLSIFAVCSLCLMGCEGPTTRILPGVSNAPKQMEETIAPENTLENANPYYIRETITLLSRSARVSGSSQEQETIDYLEQMLKNYGYHVKREAYPISGSEILTDIRTEALTDTGAAEGEGVKPSADVGEESSPDIKEEFPSGINLEAVRSTDTEDADILLVTVNHDSLPESPGANNNASGVAGWLETARLLAHYQGDTELRFVSFGSGETDEAGKQYYISHMDETEKARIVGVISFGPMGYRYGGGMVLRPSGQHPEELGNRLMQYARESSGIELEYELELPVSSTFAADAEDAEAAEAKNILLPELRLSQKKIAYEYHTTQDKSSIVNAETVAQATDAVVKTVADVMGIFSPEPVMQETPTDIAESEVVSGEDPAEISELTRARFEEEQHNRVQQWMENLLLPEDYSRISQISYVQDTEADLEDGVDTDDGDRADRETGTATGNSDSANTNSTNTDSANIDSTNTDSANSREQAEIATAKIPAAGVPMVRFDAGNGTMILYIDELLQGKEALTENVDAVNALMRSYGELLALREGVSYITAFEEEFYGEDKEERFVSELAAAGLHEDFQESFRLFILTDDPGETPDIADRKIHFFYHYPELDELRSHVRSRLDMEISERG